MFFRCITLMLLALIISPIDTYANQGSEFKISNTHTLQIKSQSSGLEYELYVRLPKSYAKGKRHYPLVLLNDTSYSMATASGIVYLMERRDIEDVILVGISYAKGDDPLISRTRDYTPTFAPKETNGHSLEAQKHSGKAKQYINFIADEVLPLINKNYRINQNKTVFVGHSFGGLLGANILLNNPELFDSYILGSPSLYYDNKVTFRLEEVYAKKHDAMKANVHLFVGGEEKWMVDHMLEFEARLKSRNYKGLHIQSQVLDGLTHFSAFAVLFTRGLQQALPRGGHKH